MFWSIFVEAAASIALILALAWLVDRLAHGPRAGGSR